MIIKEQLFFNVIFNYMISFILLMYQCVNINRIKQISLTSQRFKLIFRLKLFAAQYRNDILKR